MTEPDLGRSTIDLNSDVVTGAHCATMDTNHEVLGLVTSANIACTFPDGNPHMIRRALAVATARGLQIGAQLGYRESATEPDDLMADTIYQLGALDALARSVGATISYATTDPALYEAIVDNFSLTKALVQGIQSFNPDLPLLGVAGAPVLTWASMLGLPTFAEGFVDLPYNSDGSLACRRRPASTAPSVDECVAQAVALATGDPITATDGSQVHLHVDSLRVRTDNPAAVAITQAVSDALTMADVTVSPASMDLCLSR